MLRNLLKRTTAAEPDFITLDPERMATLGWSLHAEYINARPFPHVVIDNFLPQDIAENILEAFPEKNSPMWFDWQQRDTVHQPKKQGIGDAKRLIHAPPYIQHVVQTLNSYPILKFLQELTGIDGLVADPYLQGGGLHQILSGGKLAIHADFNFEEFLQLYRRINLLFYLNKDWDPAYGGDLELWDPGMNGCIKKIAPLFNRCVVFNTSLKSFHGHPEPLNTPEHITRKSLAFYYYTTEPNPGEAQKVRTNWQKRPGE